jgi:hypothetical protein
MYIKKEKTDVSFKKRVITAAGMRNCCCNVLQNNVLEYADFE